MENKNTFQFGWSSWVKWIAATALAFIINDGSQFFIPNQSLLSILYLLFVDGLVIAIFQWLFVLRFLTPKAHLWILYSDIGYAIGWLLGSLFVRWLIGVGWLSGSLMSMSTFIILFIHGTLLGIIQWAFFIRKLYSKSSLWILTNAIGLPLAFGLSWLVIFPVEFGNYDSPLLGLLDSAIRGTLFGSLTGVALIRLSRLIQSETDSSAIEEVQ